MRTRARAAIAGAATATAMTAQLLGGVAAHAAPARPDLVVTSVTTVGDLIAGRPATFAATIENRGAKATPAGTIHGVGFQVDGVLRTWSDTRTASLAPGRSVTVTANGGRAGATWTATSGRHELLAFVDDAQRIAESDEGNNRTKKTITVADAGIRSSTLKGAVPVTTLSALPQATSLATTVTGPAYASCVSYDATGREVARPGTETYIGRYSAGNSQPYVNAPFGWSGVGTAPGGATKVESAAIDANSIRRSNYGTPPQVMTCHEGESATFTRLHAETITTSRFSGTVEGANVGAVLSSYTGRVSTDIRIGL